MSFPDSHLKPAPCLSIIARAQETNQRNGHENLGFLSLKAGFMPLQEPLTSLPEIYQKWDSIAAALPTLCKEQTLRATVDKMPVLSANALPDRYLHRAATLLSILAHAYVWIDEDTPTALPACLEIPWLEVSRRLGRVRPYLSYIDLIVYNWSYKNTSKKEFKVEELKLLVPTVDNAEENIFYLTQAEILAQTTPLIKGVIAAQEAVLAADSTALKSVLQQMKSQLRVISRRVLAKISASPARTSHVDPVVWAKTVAPLAIALRSDVQSPGGTASPLFSLMDSFIGREDHRVFLGVEAQRYRAVYPPHWRAFIEAAGEVSVVQYVKTRNDPELTNLWLAFKEEYRGPSGLLGLHQRKVLAFIPIAFKVGRSMTNAGFKGSLAGEEWLKVHDHLEKARRERYSKDEMVDAKSKAETAAQGRPNDLAYPISELLQHTDSANGYWFAANGNIYDATSYLFSHPGGDRIVISSSGRDVTSSLRAVSHFREPFIRAKLDKYIIGKLALHNFAHAPIRALYNSTVAFAYNTASLQTTYAIDMTFLHGRFTSVESDGEMTAQKGRVFRVAQERLSVQYMPAIVAQAGTVLEALITLQPDVECEALAALPVHRASCTRAPTDMDVKTLADAIAVVEASSRMLAACKGEVTTLLRTLETLPTSCDKMPAAETARFYASLTSIWASDDKNPNRGDTGGCAVRAEIEDMSASKEILE